MAVFQLDRILRLLEMALELFTGRDARAGMPTTKGTTTRSMKWYRIL